MKIISTDKAPKAIGPYVQGKVDKGLLFTSGQLPINVATGKMPETIAEQTKQSLENVKAIVEEAGGTMDNIMKATVFLKNMTDFAEMNKVYDSFFPGMKPCRSAFEVAKLPMDALVEIEVIVSL